MDSIDYSKDQIRSGTLADWQPAIDLAWQTFEDYNARAFGQEGCRNFHDFIYGENLKKLFKAGRYQLFVVKNGERILGMLTLQAKSHISLLFVDGACFRHGIASSLIRYVSEYGVQEEGISRLTVHASPYATDFYHKLGFLDTGPVSEEDGIRFTPMILLLK